MNAIDRFNALPAERREAILARAEELIRAERAGRSAPESNQRGANLVMGFVILLGIMLPVLAAVICWWFS